MRNPCAIAQAVSAKTSTEGWPRESFHAADLATTGILAGHEFNNLLKVILSYSEGLLGRLTGGDYEEAVEIKNAALVASSVTRRVADEAGSGAVFETFFPKAVEPPRAAVPKGSSRALEKKTVLLVEDEEQVRRLLHNIFEGKGFNLLEAENGEEALLIAEYHEGDIDVLVSDIVVAGIDGMELTRRLRQVRPDVGVLLISGYGHNAFDGPGPHEEPTLLLAKPFTSDELLDMVGEVLRAQKSATGQANGR